MVGFYQGTSGTGILERISRRRSGGFLFHLQDGFHRYVVYDYAHEEVLQLCEKLCECEFGSIKDMLKGNHFYRDKIA